nr:MAG TPA: hypothetical protein [Caudoviricetes sp.]
MPCKSFNMYSHLDEKRHMCLLIQQVQGIC